MIEENIKDGQQTVNVYDSRALGKNPSAEEKEQYVKCLLMIKAKELNCQNPKSPSLIIGEMK